MNKVTNIKKDIKNKEKSHHFKTYEQYIYKQINNKV